MNIIKSIYRPEVFDKRATDQNYFSFNMIHFSLGREALRSLFQELTQRRNNALKVLIPEFICTEVMWAMEGLNISVTWYPVDVLELSKVLVDRSDLEGHDCLFIINYFGKASQFRADDSLKKLVIIEDNAHGFLSRDSKGCLLGTRFDFGIFSLRKTLPIVNGAALFVSPKWKEMGENIIQLQKLKKNVDISISKKKLRSLSLIIPVALFYQLLKLKRVLSSSVRKNLHPYVNKTIYFPFRAIKSLNAEKEKVRRAELYRACVDLLSDFRDSINIISFENQEVPYGFVFYLVDLSKIHMLRVVIEKNGMDLVNWPELPPAILNKYPGEHQYKNIYFIPFIW